MPVRKILVQIGVPVASYYRYRRQPEPVPRKPRGKRVTPLERQLVCEHAVSQPHTGYKRLADRLANDASRRSLSTRGEVIVPPGNRS